MPIVTDCFVHPLKGARPMRVPRLRLDQWGAVGDRRWVLVDANAQAITPREVAALAQLRATVPLHHGAVVAEAPLTLRRPGAEPLVVPQATSASVMREVQVWDDAVALADAGDTAAEWVSRAVDTPCRLMQWTASSRRPLAAKYAGPLPAEGRDVTITDGAPLLLLGSASLDALNARLAAAGHPALSLDRFRPNIVLATHRPHDEDAWAQLRIGTVTLGVGTPCPRCVVTTIDPETLGRTAEPLRTLAQYRRGVGGGVMFGMNATHEAPGEMAEGDVASVLAYRAAPDA